MTPETRKTIDAPHPAPRADCPACAGSGIEEMRVANADKVDITCRDCLLAGVTEADKRAARIWYSQNRRRVNDMLRERGPENEPTGAAASLPDRWKAEHWRWFMIGEVAKQIGVKA